MSLEKIIDFVGEYTSYSASELKKLSVMRFLDITEYAHKKHEQRKKEHRAHERKMNKNG